MPNPSGGPSLKRQGMRPAAVFYRTPMVSNISAQDTLKKEQAMRESAERAEAEKRERIRQEQDRRRQLELEKQMAKQREIEQEKEEYRRQVFMGVWQGVVMDSLKYR
jgi:uncharacterized protein YaiL (DUF2058 family)